MKLSIGIVGLPNVGKSTLFKALTKVEVNIANYPFATIDPNIGVVPVPDERVDKLAEMSKSKKKIPAVVEFYDIAGLVKGANKGEGLGNQFLTHIRETNAIVEVLRCFPDGEIIHVEQTVDPVRDMEIINTELALKDLDTIEKVYKKAEGEARTGNKQAKEDLEALQQARLVLEKGELLNIEKHSNILKNVRMKELSLLTAKPIIYLLNGKPEDASPALLEKIKGQGADYVVMDLSQSADLGGLIRKSYEILGLISFFTTGEDETRAWTIERGAKAPQAAGVIHTDFEKKFVKAEVIHWQKLLEVGSWAAAKPKGQLRLEGKEYVVQDGDVMEIKHG
ncbi:MAG: redox-regulated ATPase YchF [bacterium]|nr:redox-regulated ATPase YchF [bacterium]